MPFGQRIKNAFGRRLQKGLNPLLRLRNGSCAVLLYHRVADLKSDPQLLSVGIKNFEAQLKVLKNNYNILKVDEFCNSVLSEKKFPDKSVLITFDDGYYDNDAYARPLLEKYDVQGLFYICTENIGTSNEFWWDELERIILLGNNLPASIEFELNGTKHIVRTDTSEARTSFYQRLIAEVKLVTAEERKALTEQLRKWSGNNEPRSTHRSMSHEELKSFASSPGVVLGAHTHHHQSLSHQTFDVQKKEIEKSRALLESWTGKKIRHFSYPFGKKSDFNAATIAICREAGFEIAFANYPSDIHLRNNRFSLPRFLVRNWNEKEFIQHLKNFSS